MTKDKHENIAPRQHEGPYISKEERQHINQSFNTIIARPSSSPVMTHKHEIYEINLRRSLSILMEAWQRPLISKLRMFTGNLA
ncbi:hypothetical protein Bca4012_018640 [Brassica carinata]|uniref:Uncharacterized protein n=1 Tax=Brassica carinata TaxID=52824 RepID=A0A8X8BEB6_BRACI|nr:hypothetical protein Bca52824_002945 [Brassica carinata]